MFGNSFYLYFVSCNLYLIGSRAYYWLTGMTRVTRLRLASSIPHFFPCHHHHHHHLLWAAKNILIFGNESLRLASSWSWSRWKVYPWMADSSAGKGRKKFWVTHSTLNTPSVQCIANECNAMQTNAIQTSALDCRQLHVTAIHVIYLRTRYFNQVQQDVHRVVQW